MSDKIKFKEQVHVGVVNRVPRVATLTSFPPDLIGHIARASMQRDLPLRI